MGGGSRLTELLEPAPQRNAEARRVAMPAAAVAARDRRHIDVADRVDRRVDGASRKAVDESDRVTERGALGELVAEMAAILQRVHGLDPALGHGDRVRGGERALDLDPLRAQDRRAL